MPIGSNLARCHECGKTWIVGDCIPTMCGDCECAEKGHEWYGSLRICVRCGSRRPLIDCAAKRQGTAGGNDPVDCDWPNCGCKEVPQ